MHVYITLYRCSNIGEWSSTVSRCLPSRRHGPIRRADMQTYNIYMDECRVIEGKTGNSLGSRPPEGLDDRLMKFYVGNPGVLKC